MGQRVAGVAARDVAGPDDADAQRCHEGRRLRHRPGSPSVVRGFGVLELPIDRRGPIRPRGGSAEASTRRILDAPDEVDDAWVGRLPLEHPPDDTYPVPDSPSRSAGPGVSAGMAPRGAVDDLSSEDARRPDRPPAVHRAPARGGRPPADARGGRRGRLSIRRGGRVCPRDDPGRSGAPARRRWVVGDRGPRFGRVSPTRLGGRRRPARRDRLHAGDRAVAARGGAADGRWGPALRGRPGRVRRTSRRPRDPPRLSQSRVRVRAARGDDRLGGPARDPAPRDRDRARRLLGGHRGARPGRRDRGDRGPRPPPAHEGSIAGARSSRRAARRRRPAVPGDRELRAGPPVSSGTSSSRTSRATLSPTSRRDAATSRRSPTEAQIPPSLRTTATGSWTGSSWSVRASGSERNARVSRPR